MSTMPQLLSPDEAVLRAAVAAQPAETGSVIGPYARPTPQASKELSRKLQHAEAAWWIAFPLNATESRDFTAFLIRKGVVLTYGKGAGREDYEADRDLCPYVWAWRLLRGEVIFTALGRNQYANKRPFTDSERAADCP